MKEYLGARNWEDTAQFYNRKYLESGKEAFKGYDFSFFFDWIKTLMGGFRPTDSVLDCGCGHGEFLETIISKYSFGSPSLNGVDISRNALDLFMDRFKNYEFDVNLTLGGMEHLCKLYCNEKFDVVTSWGSIEHTSDPIRTFREMIEVTKFGGFIFITVPLEFDGCLTAIENEDFKNNNERFMTYKEWCEYFSQVKKPIATQKVNDGTDILLIFKK